VESSNNSCNVWRAFQHGDGARARLLLLAIRANRWADGVAMPFAAPVLYMRRCHGPGIRSSTEGSGVLPYPQT
jgi:hypothetical protein